VISPAPLTLSLTAAWLDGYCRDLVRRTSVPEKRVAALDALQTFIAVAADAGAQATSGYTAIRETLAHHLEQARAELLREAGEKLTAALRDQQLAPAAALYTALSRDAFWQLLKQVEAGLDPQATADLAAWCRHWLAQTQQAAAAHSPYPDAIDFKASGIDVTSYLMMCDLNKFFGGR
jgi:hypothetical protein